VGLVVLVAIMATASPFLSAQGGAATATIAGVVHDPKGSPVPSATVTLTLEATSTTISTETNKRGVFTAPPVPAGNWTVRATPTGFKTTVVINIRPAAGSTTTVRVDLQSGASTDVVSVQSSSDIAQVETPQITATATGEEMSRLPLVSRDAINYVA